MRDHHDSVIDLETTLSSERLAVYIRTDRWEPLDAQLRVSDATQLIANLGGFDLYGRKPDIALRELIANASDATRARSVHEGGQSSAVTVRLSEAKGSWWLEVEDHGIGMAPDTMVNALTDFGHSRWQTAAMLTDFPGLLAKGFKPTGSFGIGFFAIFMIADEVEVRSLAYGEATRSTHVLEFRHGVTVRPLLRAADVHERLRSSGTVIRAKLRHEPRSRDGLFTTTNRRMSHTQLLHSRLLHMCALADVDIKVQGPDDQQPVHIVQAGDWTRISAAELFRRIYRRDEASHLDRIIYDGYEQIFIDHASELLDGAGNVIGRAMVATGWESVHPDLRWMRPTKAPIYVGGFASGEMSWCMGAFVGYPLTADRLKAFPVADLGQFQTWLDTQAETVWHSSWSFERSQLGHLIRQLNAEAPQLPCAEGACGPLDSGKLREWATGRDQVFLASSDGLLWFNPSDRPIYLTFEGNQVELPDDYLLVDMNPQWRIPEEVSPRPRDERFADVMEAPSAGTRARGGTTRETSARWAWPSAPSRRRGASTWSMRSTSWSRCASRTMATSGRSSPPRTMEPCLSRPSACDDRRTHHELAVTPVSSPAVRFDDHRWPPGRARAHSGPTADASSPYCGWR